MGGLSVSVAVGHRILFAGDASHGDDLVTLLQANHPHALGGSPDLAKLGQVRAQGDALGADEHQLIGVGDTLDRHHQAVAIGGLDVDHALAAAAGLAVLAHLGALAVAVLADGQQRGRCVGHHQVHDHIIAAQLDALDPMSPAAHGPDPGLLEADRPAVTRAQHDFVLAGGFRRPDQVVVGIQADGDDAAGPRPAVGRQGRLLDDALGGGEEDEALLELADRQHRPVHLVGLHGQEVGDGPAAAGPLQRRNVVDLDPVHPPAVGEEQQVIVGAGSEEVLEEVAFAGVAPADPAPAAPLLAVAIHRHPLDVALAGDGHDDLLVRDHILHLEVGDRPGELGPTLVAELVAHLVDVFANDVHHQVLVAEQGLVAFDLLDQLAVLLGQLLDLQAGEFLQLHGQDGVGLGGAEMLIDARGPGHERLRQQAQERPHLGQLEPPGHQPLAGGGHVGGALDQGDDFVDVADRQDQALQHVGPLTGLAQEEHGPPADDLAAMADVQVDHLPQVQRPRLTIDQGDVHDRVVALQRGVAVELVEHHVDVAVALELNHQANGILAVRLIADVGHLGHHPGLDRGHDLLLDRGSQHLVGDLVDDDLGLVAEVLEVGLAAQHEGAAAGAISVLNAAAAADHAAGGEVRARHLGHQLLDGHVGVVDHRHDGLGHLAQVVRGHVGGHAHGDARRAVDQQVGELAGQHGGLIASAVVVGLEVHRLHAQVGEHLHRGRGHAGFGVPHRRGRVAIDRAEVALPMDERIAQVPLLGQADQGGIDDLLAVRVIVA